MKKTLYIFILTTLAVVALSLVYKLILYFSLYDYFAPNLELFTTLAFGLRFDFAIAAAISFIVSLGYFFSFTYISSASIRSYTLLVAVVMLTYVHFYALADLIYYLDSGTHVIGKISNFNYWWEISAAFIAYLTIGYFYIKAFFYIEHKVLVNHYRSIFTKTSSFIAYSFILFLISLVIMRGISAHPLAPAQVFQNHNHYEGDLAINPNYMLLYNSIYLDDTHSVIQFNQAVSPYIKQLYPKNNLAAAQQRKPANIVLILLEGWSKPAESADTVIPNFVALSKEGIRVKRMLTDATRTAQGLFVSTCSFPNPLTRQTIAESKLAFLRYHCLPELLKQRGWQTAIFQGTFTETAGVGPFAEKIGVQHSYGREDMSPRLEHHGYGVHDHDLYNFTLKQVTNYKEPFLAIINTNSTHSNEMPSVNFGATSVLEYADISLGKFIADYRKLELDLDTLFILVSDHTSGKKNMLVDRFSVVFTMFGAGIRSQYLDNIYHHQDIAPSILDVVGIDKPTHFLGKSMLTKHEPHFAYYYTYNNLTWVEENSLISINTTNHAISCYQHLVEKILCQPGHTAMRDRALAFTSYTQELLYTGNTQDFADIFK
jgi:phosphoglycerol transferase MdoB-like AlkP superfamily enzyme